MILDKLERDYEESQNRVVKYQKYYRLPIIGRFFLKKVIHSTEEMQEIFRELRYETRKIYPERFS